MHKIHLPEERKKLGDSELLDIVKYMGQLRSEVRDLEMRNNIPLDQMIDFDRLTKAFFREKKFSFGIPIMETQRKSSWEEDV